MGKIRTIILLLLMILNLDLLSGCWDMKEINDIGLVTAVGVDKTEGTNGYTITVQIANPKASGSSEGKGGARSEVWIGSAEGSSLFDATRELVHISSKKIMWAHNNVVIIGESLAREGIIPVVDFFTHNPELRMRASVVVSKGAAKEYVAAKVGQDPISGISFNLLEDYRALSGESVESHMLQVSASLKEEYGNPLIAKIRLIKATMKTQSDGSGYENPETISIEGTAIFKKDKMLGWLTAEESLGAAWILNETKNKVVTVTDPEYGNKSVSVETSGVKAKIKTKVINGIPKISIHVTGRGDIVEEDGSTNQSMSEVKGELDRLLNKKIEEEIRNSLEIIQKKYGVDVLGFADIVHAQNNRAWHNGLKDKWQEIFPQIPVEVSVNLDIKSSSLNQEPMRIY